MSGAADVTVGGESPWEIARAYPYVQVTRLSATQFQVRMTTPDDRGWPFVRALEQLAAEQPSTDAAGHTRSVQRRQAAALVLMIELVRRETGAEVPAVRDLLDSERARGRHPTARAGRGRTGRAA